MKKVIFLSEEDYKEFKDGGVPTIEILKKYLSENEAAKLESWDKDEVRAFDFHYCWFRSHRHFLLYDPILIILNI